MSDEHSAKVADWILLQKVMLRELDELRVLEEATQNPIYFWRAVAAWSDLGSRDPKQVEQPLPPWLAEKLSIFARRICDLSEGKDYRVAPEPYGDLPRVWDSVNQAHGRGRTLKPPQATRLVLQALGFKRSGWGAFRQASRLEEQDIEDLSIKGLKQFVRLGDAQAFDALLEDHAKATEDANGTPSISDMRSSRKRIQKSRMARRPKPT